MQILISTLLIANITVLIASTVTILKEVNKANKAIERLGNNISLDDMEKRLKGHISKQISKEFWDMSLRGVKVRSFKN